MPKREAQRNHVFGARLRSLRERREMSQLQYAKWLGVSRRTLQNYEAGRVPSDFVLEGIAHKEGVTTSWLLGRSFRKPNPGWKPAHVALATDEATA